MNFDLCKSCRVIFPRVQYQDALRLGYVAGIEQRLRTRDGECSYCSDACSKRGPVREPPMPNPLRAALNAILFVVALGTLGLYLHNLDAQPQQTAVDTETIDAQPYTVADETVAKGGKRR